MSLVPGLSLPISKAFRARSHTTLALLLLVSGFGTRTASASLSTSTVLAVSGPHADAMLGHVVRSADVNGDGRGDLLVGQSENGSGVGRVLVYFGANPPHVTPDVTLMSGEADDSYGVDIASAGDINGDGFDDVLVGAWQSDLEGTNAGRVYVYFGGAAMDAVPDLVLHGEPNQLYGSRVSSAGDVNGDGYDDFLATVWSTALGSRVDLYLGGESPAGVPAFSYYGENGADAFGSSLAPAGDINHDGLGDFIVGTVDNDAGGTDAGRVYVYTHYDGTLETGQPDLILTGASPQDGFGVEVAGAGDVNHDGYDDLLVGAWQFLSGGTGRAYVFFGGTTPDALPDLILNGEAAGDRFGVRVAGVRDIDGDGVDDIIVAANAHDALSGRLYVYLGSAAMDGVADATVSGEAGSALGNSVTAMQDFDGNGRRDFAAGAPFASSNGANSGKAFVYSLAGSACTLLDDWLTDRADGAQATRGITFGPAGAQFTSMSSGIDYDPSLVPAQGTIEMHLRRDDPNVAFILDTRGVGGRQPGDAAMVIDASGHLFFTIDPIGGRNPCCIPGVNSTTVFNDTDFHCVAVSYGSGGLRLYVDGVLEDANPAITASLVRSTVSLGDFPDGQPQSWLGTIRRIRTSCAQDDVVLPGQMGCGTPCTLVAGMTAWWPADGNGLDLVGGRNWTLQGGATFGPGQVSQALVLDGDGDYAEATAGGLDLGTSDFGVDAWVNFATTATEQVILEKYIETFDGSRTGWGVAFIPPNRIHFFGPVAPHPSPSIIDAFPDPPAPGTWHHLAITRSGDSFSLYWDCVLVGSSVYPGLNLSTASTLKVGKRGDPTDTPGSLDTREFYFDGRIDEVEMFVGRTLSAADVGAICAAGSNGRCKLVAVNEPRTARAGLGVRISPNPASNHVEFAIRLDRRGRFALRLYDLSGRLVRVLDQGHALDPGEHRVTWDGRGEDGVQVRSGVYWCRLQVDGRSMTRSFVVVR